MKSKPYFVENVDFPGSGRTADTPVRLNDAGSIAVLACRYAAPDDRPRKEHTGGPGCQNNVPG